MEKDYIEEILKNLEKTLDQFLEEILKLEVLKDKTIKLQNIIDISRQYKHKRDLIDEILLNFYFIIWKLMLNFEYNLKIFVFGIK